MRTPRILAASLVTALACTTGAEMPSSAWETASGGVLGESSSSEVGTDALPTATTDPSAADSSAAPTPGTDGPPPPDLPGQDDCPRVVVVSPDDVLNVRPDPSTATPEIGQLANGTIVDVIGEVQGESIDGNPLWFEIDYVGGSGFISGVFAECTLSQPPEPPDGYFLPLPCGMQATITQGNNGVLSHNGLHSFAFDFGIGVDTPLVAMADGVVTLIFDETGPGDACYNGGGPECGPYGNLVILLHGDGTATLYKHLNAVQVAPGDEVPQGGQIGLSGSTGYSTGRHAHVMRMENCGALTCQSIPTDFVEAGTPQTGDVVVSQNCP